VLKCRTNERASENEQGQSVLELVMITGFVVSIAVFAHALLAPVILEAFVKASEVVSAIGP
jgi:hypothetical protein